jgi:hypothetical protein
LSKSRAKLENRGIPTLYRRSGGPRSEIPPLPPRTVGNSHLVLQLQCCAAALIIDERMQIY